MWMVHLPHVYVLPLYYFSSQGKFGDCIKRNNHLETFEWAYFGDLESEFPLPTFDQCMILCKRMTGNKSIQSLVVNSFPLDGRELHAMTPFVKKTCLTSLEIGDGEGEVDLAGGVGHQLAKLLSSFNTLRKFKCTGGPLNFDGSCPSSQGIIKSLSGHRCLEELNLHQMLGSNKKCHNALAVLLRDCTKLSTLELDDDDVGDTCAAILAAGLAYARRLKKLHLYMAGVEEPGWFAISTLLGSKSTNITDASFVGSWAGGNMNAAVLSSISSNIAHSKKLNKLCLRGNEDIGWSGWKSLFEYVGGSECCLEKLSVANTNMSNDKMDMLTAALSKNSSLATLNIAFNDNVTIDGLRGFGTVFQSCNSVLKAICINCLDDEVARLFSDCLSNNSKLKVVMRPHLPQSDEVRLTHVGVKALENAVCNKTDIMATYNSNHTLHDLSSCLFHLPDEVKVTDLNGLLDLNKNWIPSYCARLKILKCHFSGTEVNLKPFFDMSLELLPHAIYWVGDASENDMTDSTSLMYQLIKGVPSMFDVKGKRKRKRTRRTKISDYFLPPSK